MTPKTLRSTFDKTGDPPKTTKASERYLITDALTGSVTLVYAAIIPRHNRRDYIRRDSWGYHFHEREVMMLFYITVAWDNPCYAHLHYSTPESEARA